MSRAKGPVAAGGGVVGQVEQVLGERTDLLVG